MIPVDDKDALVNAMKKMIESADRYKSAGLRNYVQERFSEQAVTSQLKNIYLKCVDTVGKSIS